MVTQNTLEEIAARATRQRDSLTTEEATKHALILPFIQALGYNVFDPTEVVPEFTADYGLKTGEKVDYAIIQNDAPSMLFECKKLGDPLGAERASQLARYFANTSAQIGVLTDGVVYKFFSDLDAENVMDTNAFFEIDLTNTEPRDIQTLGFFTKSAFDLEQARSTASTLKHIAGMKAYLTEMLGQPDEDFVRLLARRVYTGLLVQSRMEHFTSLAKLAFHEFVNDHISDTLRRASDIVNSDISEVEAVIQADDDDDQPEGGQRNIVTTAEELEGYELVKAIVGECVDPERVVIRDNQSYCAIVLDNNNRKPICRLRFTPTRKRLELLDSELGEDGRKRRKSAQPGDGQRHYQLRR